MRAPLKDKSDCLNTQLSAAPVTTLAVVLDLALGLQPEPLRKRLVLLLLHTQGALGAKTLKTRHTTAHPD